MPFKGSCLCGAVAYEVDAVEDPVMHCHCATCRKAHAAAHGTVALVKPGNFRWLRGEDRLTAYESSPGKVRRFCPVCGSHVVASKEGVDAVLLRVATLDDDPGNRPAMHIWTAHDVPWLAEEGLERHREFSPK
ncbi:MAG: aldehyde-activating protein [Alphaproteobacteria bacterium]|nr:aldehyde-activating protein [Alphaproteobacteria bacterium]